MIHVLSNTGAEYDHFTLLSFVKNDKEMKKELIITHAYTSIVFDAVVVAIKLPKTGE